jgi:hypothetical protein
VAAQELQDDEITVLSPTPTLIELIGTVPSYFKTVSEAREYLDLLVHHWLSIYFECAASQANSDDSIKLHGPFVDALTQWKIAFASLIGAAQQQSSLTDLEVKEVHVLQIRALHCTAVLAYQGRCRGVAQDELIWDDFAAEHEQMISLAESCLGQDSSNRVPVFSLQLGIVAPLYMMALQCRDPRLRRRALAVLRQYPRREGFWDSVRATTIVEFCIAAEESMVMGDTTGDQSSTTVTVPLTNRITDVRSEFRWEDKVSILHYTQPASSARGGTLEKVAILAC